MEIDEFKEMILKHAHALSVRISEAIPPLNELTMPIVVFVLQNYATAIKNDPDFDNELYAILKASLRGTVFRADKDNPESMAILEEIRAGRKNYE